MALKDDIAALRDQVLADLTSAHDYYADTIVAWNFVLQMIEAGEAISSRNETTGTVTTQTELAAKAGGYVAEQLAEATFQQFISIFENFYFDLLRLWLTAYPQSMGRKTLDFKTILEMPDKEAMIGAVVRDELNRVQYERPARWFSYLEDLAKLGCPAPDEIGQLAEAKASRDVLVHNKRIANKIYEAKAGKIARFHEGERLRIPDDYHGRTWDLLRKLVADLTNAAITKSS